MATRSEQRDHFRFIHSADIHLDSPLQGLDRYEGAPVEAIRLSTRQALEKMIFLAIQERVDFLLIAGDLYDGDWKDYNTGLYFVKMMAQLKKENIPVFLIAGNHDAASQITKGLPLPSNVHRFSESKPETVLLEEINVAIHGQSFPRRDVQENLALKYPEAKPDRFNIGMLHTCATGREGHDSYAPCNIQDLVEKNYQYWALGHVHTREIIREEPWIVFPGNPQGRHIRETGSKGCTLVTVEQREVLEVEHKPVDVFRWAVCRIDASEISEEEELELFIMEQIEQSHEENGNLPLAVRIEIQGSTSLHQDLCSRYEEWIHRIRAKAGEVSNGEVWIENVKLKTQSPLKIEAIPQREGLMGELLRGIQEIENNKTIITELQKGVEPLLQKLPLELRELEGMNLKDSVVFQELLQEVKHWLLPQIFMNGDSE